MLELNKKMLKYQKELGRFVVYKFYRQLIYTNTVFDVRMTISSFP